MALSPGPYEDSLGSTAVLSIKEFFFRLLTATEVLNLMKPCKGLNLKAVVELGEDLQRPG